MEEEECIKEVIFEVEDVAAVRKEEERRNLKIEEKDIITAVAVDGDVKDWQVIQNEEDEDLSNGGDKEREEEISKKAHIVQVVNNPQEAPTKEEEVWQEPQVSSCFVQDAPNLESKGEGLLPYECGELAQSDVLLHDLCDGSSSTYTLSQHLCEEIVSEKSILALAPNERQIVDQFLFLLVEDLEMGDASSPLLWFDEGQEMGDSSSGPELVIGSSGKYNFANSWEEMSNQGDFLKDFGCHAINSLWLFLFEGKVLRSGIWFILETTNFGVSYPLLLQAQEEKGLLKGSETSKVISEEEDEEEDDWGFDEPTYIMEADMQENVSKAMERIASLKEAASWQHVTEYPGSLDTFVLSFNVRNTRSIMWHVVCVLSATLPTFGAPFDGYQYHWVGIMLYACHRVLWDTRIKLWDPGQITFHPVNKWSYRHEYL